MAQAVSRRPLTAATRVRAQINPVGFVVDKVTLGQDFLRVLWFFPCQYQSTVGSTFPKIKKKIIYSPLHSSSSGDGQKARKSGSSPVRRQSHPPSHPHNQNTTRTWRVKQKYNNV
jgi:hypothetical protein